MFTVWTPRFLSWVQQLPAYAFSPTEVPSSLTLSLVLKTLSNAKGVLRLGGTALQWMVSLPIMSLAPLKPTQLFNPQALSPYLGGGTRLLYSLENFPQESVFGAVAVAYFVGYALGDLILGFIHYPDQVDPLSGWAHHIVYTLLAWRLAMANHLWIFSICGGPLEGKLGAFFIWMLFGCLAVYRMRFVVVWCCGIGRYKTNDRSCKREGCTLFFSPLHYCTLENVLLYICLFTL